MPTRTTKPAPPLLRSTIYALSFSKVAVIPARAQREPGIHNHDREYGFRARAKWRIHDVQLHIVDDDT
jgi:hypothetical protein